MSDRESFFARPDGLGFRPAFGVAMITLSWSWISDGKQRCRLSSSPEKKLELAAAPDFGCGAIQCFGSRYGKVEYSGESLISRPNIAFKNIEQASKDL